MTNSFKEVTNCDIIKNIPHVESMILDGYIKERVTKSKIDFKLGPNVIIGPNGSGKSTLFQILLHPSEQIKKECKVESISGTYYAFDFEKDNPRKSSTITKISQIDSRFKSHGEINKRIIKLMTSKESENAMFFLDEPEQALDIDGLKLLMSCVKKTQASQIMIITHHPYIILNPIFNVIELKDNYLNEIKKFVNETYKMTL